MRAFVSMRMVLETINASQPEYFDEMKVEVVLKRHRINIRALRDCNREWSSLLTVVKLGRPQHSLSGLQWPDENTVHWGLQDFSFSYLLNI